MPEPVGQPERTMSMIELLCLVAAGLAILFWFAGGNAEEIAAWWQESRPSGFSWSGFSHVDSNGDFAVGGMFVHRHQEGNP